MRQLTLFLLLATAAVLSAQPKQNSPYSRFGIGDPVNQYFANQAGWGGQTAAFHDAYHLNLSNPASYAHLRSTALETGLYAKYSSYKSNTSTLNNWSGNLAYLALGFTLKSPINEVLDKAKSPWKFGMGAAVTPYSLIGYKVEILDSTANIGKVSNGFQGNGGSYRLTWSSAAKYKNTALGVNIGWMFGKATYETTTDFNSDVTYSFIDNERKELGINGFVWGLGLQHDIVLQNYENDKDSPLRWITLGLTAESKHNLRITADDLFVRSRTTSATGVFGSPDTLTYVTGVKQNLTIPAAFTFGVQYVNATKFKAGLQIGLEQWSQYANQARPESFRNTFKISGGVEYTPDFASYNNYSKRIRYRAGAFFRQDPRSDDSGNELNDVGLTLGLGFPITLPRQQTSFVNAAFELGKLGAGSDIEETYLRMTLGFTLNDNTWFYKRRFE